MANQTTRVPQTLGLRIWHWLSALAILGLLGTVLIRKTLLSWRINSVVIQEKLAAAGHVITPEFAKDIAVTIRNPLWDWHIYLGYTLTALLVTRVLVGIVNRKTAKPKPQDLHKKLVKLSYVAFYLATLFMVVTGLLLTFKTDLDLAKDLAGTIKEWHEFTMSFFVLFVGAHLIGVVVSENRGDRGIVSDMINGGGKKT